MTRKEYMMNEVEILVNTRILPLLKEKQLDEKDIRFVNMTGFLYSCNRVQPLEVVMLLSKFLNEEEIRNFFKEVD